MLATFVRFNEIGGLVEILSDFHGFERALMGPVTV
jgi:hypothetical protein